MLKKDLKKKNGLKMINQSSMDWSKIGNWPDTSYHDVGIVFSDRPYIISIMSKNIDVSEVYKVIANISKKVYDFETSDD